MKTYVYDPRNGRITPIIHGEGGNQAYAALSSDTLMREGMIWFELEWREIKEIHVCKTGRQIELML